MTPLLRLGTRRSPLALAQARLVARALEERHPEVRVELVPIVTTGDQTKGELAPLGGKGLFTKELEEGLLSGDLDLAVHSLKDLPVRLPDGLVVAAYPERAAPYDVLVSEEAQSLRELPPGSVLLTGALRRRAQILHLRPDLQVEAIRGNVDTRLRKWRERRAAGVILAAAGLQRLGRDRLPLHPIPPEEMLPAPGQGILAVEIRAGSQAEADCRALDHPLTRQMALAERQVVAAFGGSCNLPLAAWARPEGEGRGLHLTALLATPDGQRLARGEAVGTEPLEVAAECVATMEEAGAREILARLGQGEA